ncbi:CHY zinc finger protein [Caldifermentibacillus hisashii]|uniref:CHY zinc finger protein n=1 Tax=Caldifermentibacillus hisashii TaxID=996558 RepID=A0ABU9K065_9BACI|nr:CHY zinc finger protein [Caldibacillus thermoamylovorans]MCM3797866.1 CHY zinc finger protein [Caldibacillus thermoamylovorans]
MEVYGALVDGETRCTHYHSEKDIIAIKFKCCNQYYPCYRCHNEFTDHGCERWKREEFGTKAVLCGHCKEELTIRAYLDSTACPSCHHPFNEKCALHYHLYFDM